MGKGATAYLALYNNFLLAITCIEGKKEILTLSRLGINFRFKFLDGECPQMLNISISYQDR